MLFVIQFLVGLVQGFLDFFRTSTILVGLIGNTPYVYATDNPVVHGLWVTMVGVADAFLGLYVVVKLIQIMYGDATGTIRIPIGAFVSKVILTVILVHASGYLGGELLFIVNNVCSILLASNHNTLLQVNGGQALSSPQQVLLGASFGIIYGFSVFRVLFQAIRRVVFFNVLFVLSGPAFLMSLDVQTAPWFQFWLRTFLVTIFQQFFQLLVLSLGDQFFLATKFTGTTGFILAIAILNLTAEIPALLSRFAASAGTSVAGVGGLLRSAAMAAALFV